MSRQNFQDLQDEELMAIFISNRNINAFEVLLDRYKNPLFNYIKRLTSDFHKAEDLCQEVFLRIVKNRFSFNEDFKFSTWAYSIATNLCKDERRKDIIRQKELLENGYGGSQLSNPESSIIEKDIREKIRVIISLLPQKLKTVFILAEYEGFSYEKISEVLEIPVGTVKSRMHNALKQLLKNLRKEELINDLQ